MRLDNDLKNVGWIIMKYLSVLLILGLLVAHQDYWQWNRYELVFGFLPHTVAWHMSLCLVTAAVWLFITTFCWPTHLDAVESAEARKERAE